MDSVSMNDDVLARGLVAEARAGSQRAFNLLTEHYYESVLKYFLRRTVDCELAADLTQDTFLDAFLGLGRLRCDEQFGGWLFGIARKHLLMEWRRKKLRDSNTTLAKMMEQQRLSHEYGSPEARCNGQDLIEHVLSELGPNLGQVLLLHSYFGFKTSEVAKF